MDTHYSGIRDWVTISTISHVSHLFPPFPDAFGADEFDANTYIYLTWAGPGPGPGPGPLRARVPGSGPGPGPGPGPARAPGDPRWILGPRDPYGYEDLGISMDTGT